MKKVSASAIIAVSLMALTTYVIREGTESSYREAATEMNRSPVSVEAVQQHQPTSQEVEEKWVSAWRKSWNDMPSSRQDSACEFVKTDLQGAVDAYIDSAGRGWEDATGWTSTHYRTAVTRSLTDSCEARRWARASEQLEQALNE